MSSPKADRKALNADDKKKRLNAKNRSRSRSMSMERKYRGVKLTPEMEAEDPILSGMFEAAAEDDINKLEEIMEHIEDRYRPRRPADRFVDEKGEELGPAIDPRLFVDRCALGLYCAVPCAAKGRYLRN